MLAVVMSAGQVIRWCHLSLVQYINTNNLKKNGGMWCHLAPQWRHADKQILSSQDSQQNQVNAKYRVIFIDLDKV